MSYFDFGKNDIIHTHVVTNPVWSVSLQGNSVTGSINLERPYLDTLLATRQAQGFSEQLGGLTTKFANITASVDIKTANISGSNRQLYAAIQNLYKYYSLQNQNYSLIVAGVQVPSIRVITIPQIYYDRAIKSGTFVGSDINFIGSHRSFQDDGIGGISTPPSLTQLGNIFYSEGLVVLKDPSITDFGSVALTNFKWKTSFAGTHSIPVNMYRCRAPAGQLNASTNSTFFTIPTVGSDKNTRQILTSSVYPYITAVGLYNEDYELVAVARLAQPIKKEFAWDISINCKMDW